MKGANIGLIACDQGGCNELGELQNRQLFRVVAQSRRAVEHLGAFALGLAEQMGRVKIFAVKRRVFAHDHCGKIFQRSAVHGGLDEPIGGVPRQVNLMHQGRHRLALLPAHIGHLTGQHLMPALLRLAHHRERGVLVDLERFEGVGNEEDFHHEIVGCCLVSARHKAM